MNFKLTINDYLLIYMTYIPTAYTLEELEKFITYQPKLIKLQIYDCYDVEYLPDSIGNFVNLQELDICDCYSLKEIPHIV